MKCNNNKIKLFLKLTIDKVHEVHIVCHIAVIDAFQNISKEKLHVWISKNQNVYTY